jgi:RimJ/RimL family protein N-acetyltransferase
MRHHYTIQEGRYRLRPAALKDAEFIVRLRTDPERNRFINSTSSEVGSQIEWLCRYFERPNDFYFVIEHVASCRPEGTLGIYEVDAERRSAEWGRWVVRPGSKAAIASCCLAFDLAFGEMKLESLHSIVATENHAVISVLKAVGMREEASLPGHLLLNGKRVDASKMGITASGWRGSR